MAPLTKKELFEGVGMKVPPSVSKHDRAIIDGCMKVTADAVRGLTLRIDRLEQRIKQLEGKRR